MKNGLNRGATRSDQCKTKFICRQYSILGAKTGGNFPMGIHGAQMQRSKLGGHVAGIGTHRAFIEEETMYVDQKVSVRLPSDGLKGASLEAMSGPVIRSNIFELLPECETCGHRMHEQFLKPWNEKRVCVPCITELTAEVEIDVYSYS